MDDFDYGNIDDENFEPVTKGVLTPGIQIRNLKKTYTTSYLRRTVCSDYTCNLLFLLYDNYITDSSSCKRNFNGFI